jgi:hypothetical protein
VGQGTQREKEIPITFITAIELKRDRLMGYIDRIIQKVILVPVNAARHVVTFWPSVRRADPRSQPSTGYPVCGRTIDLDESFWKDKFVPAYYVKRYPDVAVYGPGRDRAVAHYRECGINEGRSPNPYFDPQYYLSTHADLTQAFGSNDYGGALEHWLEWGIREDREGAPDCHQPNGVNSGVGSLAAGFNPGDVEPLSGFLDDLRRDLRSHTEGRSLVNGYG